MVSKSLSSILAALLFLAVALVTTAIYFSAYSSGPSVYMTPPDTALPPVVVPIASGSVAVPRGAHRDFRFVLPSHICHVIGRFAGIQGSGVAALLLSDSSFAHFQAGANVKPYWDSGNLPDAKIDVLVLGPGVFHLFVVNESGPRAPRPVTLEAQARCR